MSKFHVGDKVRIASGAWIPTYHKAMVVGSVGVIIDVVDDEYEYEVQVESETEFFDDAELRPADIFAQIDEDLSFVLPSEAFTEGADEAPALHAMAVAKAVDSVNHPSHYTRFPVEVINFTEQLDFNRGNAVKYIARAGFKDGVDELEDLSKAAWYVNRAIEKLKKERSENVE